MNKRFFTGNKVLPNDVEERENKINLVCKVYKQEKIYFLSLNSFKSFEAVFQSIEMTKKPYHLISLILCFHLFNQDNKNSHAVSLVVSKLGKYL